MPRQRREHEEYLEDTEPVAVVVLNDVAYLLEDLAEIMQDLAKLVKRRPDEVREAVKSLNANPTGLDGVMPAEIAQQVQASAMALMFGAMSLQGQFASPDGEGAGPLAKIDPDKIEAEPLEQFGQVLAEQATALERAVQTYEKKLLEARQG